MKITRRFLESTKPEGDYWDTELKGFHVRIGSRGKTFRLVYSMSGKRRVKTLGRYPAVSVEEARRAAGRLLARISLGDLQVHNRHVTVRQYLEGPYSVYQSRKKTGKDTLRVIRKHFEGLLDRELSKLSRTDIERWQASNELLYAYSSMRRYFAAFKGLLNHAEERGFISVNPLKRVKIQKYWRDDDECAGARRYLEPDEVKKLFKGLDRYQHRKVVQRINSIEHGKTYLPRLEGVPYVDYVKPAMLLLYYTGFRQGDVLGLKWGHVDLKRKVVRKVVEKTAHHNPMPQMFPLSSIAVKVLAAWRTQNKITRIHDEQYVFTNRKGGRLDPKALQGPWKLIKEFGLLDSSLDLYTLRHNFASKLVMKGVDLMTVSKLMGHSDIQTTVRYYAHLRPDHVRSAVELL